MDRGSAYRLLVLICALAVLTACGGNVSTAGTPTGTPAVNPGTPPPTATNPIQHIVVVVEENHSYEAVIGNPDMPYLNSLANKYALATGYYADAHPSIGNYFMLTTGTPVTLDDAYTGTVTTDNLARVFRDTGKSWNVFAEDLPSIGYLGGDTGAYVKHHNPFAYFSDVINDVSQAQNIVPFSQFTTAISRNALPNFSLVIPNNADNAHDGTLATADAWLRDHIEPLLANATFQQSGLLLIVFDEGAELDFAHGGGHVAAVLVGSRAKAGYRSTTFFQHENALHLILEQLQVSRMPGAAKSALSMNELLQ